MTSQFSSRMLVCVRGLNVDFGHFYDFDGGRGHTNVYLTAQELGLGEVCHD